jgi:hypothetical protein
MAGDVHLHGIPGWVWACLIVAVFFLGIISIVPEARQSLGKLFISSPSDGKVTQPAPNPQSLINSETGNKRSSGKVFSTKEEAEKACGKDFHSKIAMNKKRVFLCGGGLFEDWR